MEEHLGRPLSSDEHIHHINGDPADNSIENLELVSNSEHRKIHAVTACRNELGQWAKKEH